MKKNNVTIRILVVHISKNGSSYVEQTWKGLLKEKHVLFGFVLVMVGIGNGEFCLFCASLSNTIASELQLTSPFLCLMIYHALPVLLYTCMHKHRCALTLHWFCSSGATFLRLWVGQFDPDSSTIPLAILYKHTSV